MKKSAAHLILLAMILLLPACAIQQSNHNAHGKRSPQAHQSVQQSETLRTISPPVIPRDQTPAPVIIETVWDAFHLNRAITQDFDKQRIQQQRQRYLNEPDYLPLVMQRAKPFLYHILHSLEQRQLPSELALLPVIESAYLTNARSRHGAGGLWQMMPPTARELGLKQSWLYDGRDDVIQATEAAFNYLQLLNKRLDGDWLLTLAAYNAGFTTINNAIKANLQKGDPTDYWSLQLPDETMNYVPRFLAIVSMVEDPDHYGIQLPSIPYAAFFEPVVVNKAISLNALAKQATIDHKTLNNLNPAFKQGVTPGRGEFQILAPITKADLVRKNIPKLPIARLNPQQHNILRGETLSHISNLYGVSIASLRQANQLRNNRIRAGSRMIIPQPSQSITRTTQNLHIVRMGETLWGIARQYQITVNQLAQLNAISAEATLHPGRTLIIREG